MDTFKKQNTKKHVKNNNGLEKFYESLSKLYSEYRFFYHVLKNLKIQETGDVWMAGVGYNRGDATPTLFFNSQSFDKYKYVKKDPVTGEKTEHEYSPTYKELTGVLVHELMHICQNIFGRQKMFNMNLKYANIAHDILINREIPALANRQDYDALANFLVHANQYPSLKGQDLDKWSLPQVYDAVKQDSESSGGKGKIDLDTLKEMIENGELIVDYHGMEDPDSPELTEEAQAYLNDIVKNAAKQCERENNWGSMPGELGRQIKDLMKPKNTWRQSLEYFVQNCRLDTTQHTWKKHSRRYGNRAPGRKSENAPNLLIGIDTSGSIGEQDFDLFYSYMVFAATFCRSVKVVFCDTRITFAEELNIDQKNKFPKSAMGGGGTDMQPIFDYAKAEKVDGVILLTDGCHDTVNTHNIPAVALIPKRYETRSPGVKVALSIE